jgi:uncharacterized protein with GYD domain
MPKYLVAASYTPEGLRGLAKDKASGRHTAAQKALAGIGGKLEAMYFAFGETDVFIVFDCPDNVSAASISLAVSATGLIKSKTVPLLTIEEVDQALSKSISFSPPGSSAKP